MKILVAADGSPFTKRMLAYIAAHDTEWLSERHDYTILTVVPPVPSRAASALSKDVLESYYSDEADKVFKPIREFFEQKKLPAQFVAKHGHAADIIAAVADAGKYDLLMLGSHGHSALGNLVMGSVATKVVGQCGVPVLLVR
jgi:nucleotide-binding universal stress UspA family protein